MKYKCNFTLTFPNAGKIELVSQRKIMMHLDSYSAVEINQTTQRYDSQRGQAQQENLKNHSLTMQKYVPCCQQACEQCMSCGMRNMHLLH